MNSFGINNLNFNQDNSCFVCSCKNGFRIFNSNPLRQIHYEESCGSVGNAEMLFRCNYVALVGNGSNPLLFRHKVFVWDLNQKKSIIELEMNSDVCGVRLRRDRIIVILESLIHIFSFSDVPKPLHVIDTFVNKDGVCALSSSMENSLVAYPSPVSIGTIEVFDLGKEGGNVKRIAAHTHKICALTFNASGNILASASEKGTIIRLFDIHTMSLLKEFRRGSKQAKIFCLNFSPDSNLIAAASNHSTIHVFQLSPTSTKKKIKTLQKYIQGDVSFSKLRLTPFEKNDLDSNVICQCAFDANSESIIAICSDGSYYKFQFDRNNGKCTQQTYCLFAELNN